MAGKAPWESTNIDLMLCSVGPNGPEGLGSTDGSTQEAHHHDSIHLLMRAKPSRHLNRPVALVERHIV